MIKAPIEHKFNKLQEVGRALACLFPTREAYNDFNYKMLQSLSKSVKEKPCCDLVDESGSIQNGTKKADHLKKLNKKLNNMAGLEALLKVAVGVRFILHCNVKVKKGSTLGTVLAIAATHITIKFTIISKPCEIKMLRESVW